MFSRTIFTITDKKKAADFMEDQSSNQPADSAAPESLDTGAVRRISDDAIAAAISLLGDNANPNSHALAMALRELPAMALSVKYFGYELAHALAAALPVREGLAPQKIDLGSKPSTQADIAAAWTAYWCSELKIPVVFHRKIWELAYVLQAIYNHDAIGPGKRGLGFGCGQEPLPSYLTSKGAVITVTDLPPEDMGERGWADTAQHTSSLDMAFHDHLVDRETFEKNASLRYVDMTDIPDDLTGYDFCWSICAFEHLGSIELGLKFVEDSMKTLKTGGVSVHTTEFNFMRDDATIDNWPTVLFQRRHFIELAERLEAKGHKVAPLDFNIGADPLDRFIDIPPFAQNLPEHMREMWEHEGFPHIKLSVDGFPCTCFGIIVTKGEI
jgi:hypothetical protein